jgi:hypothetical protein
MLKSSRGFGPLALLVFLVSLLIYAHTWDYGYTCLDDVTLIVDKAPLLQKPSSLLGAFTQRYYIDLSKLYYRPLVNLSFVLNAQLGGTQPFVQHLTNGWLHALACVLVFAWMRQLRLGNGPAAAAAVFFAVHPIHVASVAWIPGRNDLLLGCFGLGALLLLTRHLEQPGMLSKTGHLLLFLAALFSKETAFCLPIVFAVLVFARPRRLRSVEYGWLLAGWTAAIVACLWVRSAFVTVPPAYASKLLDTMWGVRDVLLADLGKLLLPVRLQVLAAQQDILLWPGVIGTGLVALLLTLGPLRRSLEVLACTLVIMPLLMALMASDQVILENRLYLPAVGLALLVGELLRVLLACRTQWAAAAYATVGGVSLMMAITTVRNSGSYRDCESFSRAAMAASPSSSLARWLYGAHSAKNTASSSQEMVVYGTVVMPLSTFRSLHGRSSLRTSAQPPSSPP